MGNKPPAADVVRVSKGERHDLGAAAPFSTTTSSIQGGAGGSAFTPKLVELVFGPGSTRLAEKLSPCIACAALAAPSVPPRVLVFESPSTSMARRGCRTSCSRLAKCCSKSLVISSIFPSHTFSIFRLTSTSVGWSDPTCWGTGPLPSKAASLYFCGIGKPQYQETSCTSVLVHPCQRKGQDS